MLLIKEFEECSHLVLNEDVSARIMVILLELEVSCVKNYFDNIYCSSGRRDFESILDYVPSVITVEDNLLLSNHILGIEIKNAIFYLGGLKAPGIDIYLRVFFTKENWMWWAIRL